MNLADAWLETWLEDQIPFSFQYGSLDSDTILSKWQKTVEKTLSSAYDGFDEYTIRYFDPKSRLSCLVEFKAYNNYPAFDWVIKFKNEGTEISPILSEIYPLELFWDPMTPHPFLINYAKGSDNRIDDFLPQQTQLANWKPFELKGQNGRSSGTTLPFFNIHTGNTGIIAAIGWTGQWFCRFTQNQPNSRGLAQLIIEAGMEKTHLCLYPGEEIRTPRILLFFWEGNYQEQQNLYRQLILTHYSPKRHEKLVQVPLCYPTWGGTSIIEHLDRINTIQRHQLKYDYYWVDAGWFLDETEKRYEEKFGTWANWVGRWRPNEILYPKGLKQLSDAIHNAGMKFLLWFEPERARKHTELPNQHPEFFYKRDGGHQDLLFKLGDPLARAWLIEFLTQKIKEFGIDCYRQDFNFEPLPYWQQADAPDRQGIAEIRHIEGLYELWDTLLERFPDLIIDNCASGGRRIDLETISRSIPLWRSDYQCNVEFNPTGSQIATYGLMQWAPLSSTGCVYRPNDTYNTRSAYSSGLVFHHILEWQKYSEKDYPWDWLKMMIDEYVKVRPYFYGHYYPLGNCTESETDWLVYQCHLSDQHAGIVLAFRRPASPFIQAEFILYEIDSTGTYQIENVDDKIIYDMPGKDLVTRGLNITLKNPRCSRLYYYHLVQT
jgi:alpha-galactosidase